MKYRFLDDGNDMVFGVGGMAFGKDTPATVAQAVATRLRLFLGEWFLDTGAGTPHQQGVLGTNTRDTIEPTIRKVVLETQGVTGIETFSMSQNNNSRVLSIDILINTLYGQTRIFEVL